MADRVKNKIMDNIALPVAMVATAVLAGITAAASIEIPLKNALVSAAGLFELYFLFLMIKEL
jgi:hypothetical protein